LRIAAYLGSLFGLAVLLWLFVGADYKAMLHLAVLCGWSLFWLVPYRGVYFILYSLGWFRLLHPYDPTRRAPFGYVFWVTTVREAIDRLLPVASVGGGIVGVRLMAWRGLPVASVAATVIAEILLTLVALYLFTVLGLLLLAGVGAARSDYWRLLLAALVALPIPLVTGLLLRHGSVFARLERALRPWVGITAMSGAAAALDLELRACLRRPRTLLFAGSLQLVALIAGSFEIWFVLRLVGHPVGFAAAVIMESLTQALRHLAFFVPAGLGVQEASLVILGHAFGVSSELSLTVSIVKRLRELLCGLPPLLSWQWLEARRWSAVNATPSGSPR
jgi:putative membrane protein